MGQTRQATLAAWLEKTGLQPATDEEVVFLDLISNEAVHLIRAIEYEKLGIRDDEHHCGIAPVISGLTTLLAEYGRLSAYSEEVEFAMRTGVEIMRQRQSGGR
jgi:hypothetical protein